MFSTCCRSRLILSIFRLLYLFFLLKYLMITTAATDTTPSSPAISDTILLNCGSSESSSFNGKNWTGDVGSKFMPSSPTTTITSVASNRDIPKVPYLTARIFHSPFPYTFPFPSSSFGPIFIRLYFYPTFYSGLNPTKAYFSVTAANYTLLNNFSPSVTAAALKSPYFTKDFCVNNVKELTILTITFTPSPAASKSFAFVNGIEISSMPKNLYIHNVSLPFIGHQEPFFIHDETALEFLYRVNVRDLTDNFGVQVEYNFTSLSENWLKDDLSYISSERGTGVAARDVDAVGIYNSLTLIQFAAPVDVYGTARTMGSNDAINVNYNLTWSFPVDSGFKYLVRLHFCEISLDVTEVNQRVFKVYINNLTAEDSMDLIALNGAPFAPMYRDYVVIMVPEEGTGNKRDVIWLALHPNTQSKPKYADAILNGIEIIKLSDGSNNLAANVQLEIERTVKKKVPIRIIIGCGLGSVVAGLTLLLCCFIVFRRRPWKRSKRACPNWVSQSYSANHHHHHHYWKENMPEVNPSDLCRQFQFTEITAATNNFDEALVVGSGGFGKVYKGFIDGGVTKVAIKRGNPRSHQGVREFQNEIELLSKFRHQHLVSLIGYCQENSEMILVYDYMAHGTLRDHLYRTQNPPLPWKQRLKICVGAARGLHYLHTGAKHSIIHRDVKTTNILLDQEWTAKVSDFGLSRVGPTTASRYHVSTQVKGTLGYLDPEYYRRRKLTEKSDVYSFGVVLFEVLCARPAVNPTVEEEEDGDGDGDGDDDEKVGLVEWALHCYQTGTICRMIDTYLSGKIDPDCLTAFTEIAVKCLADKGIERPSMADVLGNLELALLLQESADAKDVY